MEARRAQFSPGFIATNNYYLNELGISMIFLWRMSAGSTGYGKTFLSAGQRIEK